jgi:hypothetical protein
MLSKLLVSFRRVFPIKEYATCQSCGEVGLKYRMYKMEFYGYFCTEEEANTFWKEIQL